MDDHPPVPPGWPDTGEEPVRGADLESHYGAQFVVGAVATELWRREAVKTPAHGETRPSFENIMAIIAAWRKWGRQP